MLFPLCITYHVSYILEIFSRSGYVRGKQHMEVIREPVYKHQTNAFARHIMDRHNGNETRFEMSIVKYNGTPFSSVDPPFSSVII